MNKLELPPVNRVRIFIGILLSACSAVLLWLAYPPFSLGLLIGIGFIPMLVAQYRVLPRKISSLAPAITISGWLGALLIPAFGGKSMGMAMLPVGIFGLVFISDKQKRAFHQRTAYRWFVMEGVLGWVGLEMARSFIPAIGTWAFLGYVLWNLPCLIQPLSVFGIYGLDLLVMLSNYVWALVLFWRIDSRRGDERALLSQQILRRWVIGLVILMAGWTGFSLWLYSARNQPASHVKVAAIQPNLPRAAHRDTTRTSEERLSVLRDLTRQAAFQGAEVVVWPEMVLGFDPRMEYTLELKTLAAETGAYIVIGAVEEDEDGFHNEATLISPTGEYLGTYGKNHPMIASGERRTVNAGRYPIFETSLAKIGILICFDASFTDSARQLGSQGVQLIANPSLFGPSIAHLTHTMVVFRAIENRSAVVMADVAYNSAIVDPFGHILQYSHTEDGEQALLVTAVPLMRGETLYTKFGDWLGWFCLVGWVVTMVGMPLTLKNPITRAFTGSLPK